MGSEMCIRDRIELVPHGGERSGLDLDELVAAGDVGHEVPNPDLEAVAGPGVLGLERSMQGALVEGADVGIVSDPATLPVGTRGATAHRHHPPAPALVLVDDDVGVAVGGECCPEGRRLM